MSSALPVAGNFSTQSRKERSDAKNKMISQIQDDGVGGPQRERHALDPHKLDSANHFAVSMMNDGIVILHPKCGPLSRAEALNMSAWIVVLTGATAGEFCGLMAEIKKK